MFCNRFAALDLTSWQEEYVQLFDYSRSVSLHIFEHIKGDSRDRGQAMVNLMEFYKETGMHLTAKELPDYIPAFLEFLSTLDVVKSAGLLAETVNIMDRINEALSKSENPLDLDAEYAEEPVTFGGDAPSCSSQATAGCRPIDRPI